MKIRTMIPAVLGATLLVTATAVKALPSFPFQGFGGFTGPTEDVCAPDCNIGVPPATPALTPEYDVENTEDMETLSFQHFGWGTPGFTEHSHLTSNEIDPTGDSRDPANFVHVITPGVSVTLNPIVPPGAPGFQQELIGPIAANDPDGEIVGWFDHHNNPLASPEFGGDQSPAQVSFHYHVQIQNPDDPAGPLLFDSGELFFVLDLWETLNLAGACPPGGGSTGPSGSVCDDRLKFGTGFPISPTIDAFDQVLGDFDYLGDEFGVRVNAFWDNDQQTGAGWSREEGVTRFFVRAQVTTIPEPGIVALLSLGFAGFAFVRGRRRRVIWKALT